MKAKVVVIGSGLAGTLLCNEVVKYFDVTLLESGAKESIQIPAVHYIKKKLANVPTFCFGGGGTTNLWHNGLIPIHAEDITSEVFRSVLDDARSYTDQAASALYFKNGSFLEEYEKLLVEINTLSNSLSVLPHGVDCLLYPKKYHKLALDSKVRAIYNVQHIDFLFEAKRIKVVEYELRNSVGSLDADYVLVSAGALGSPKLLQQIVSKTDGGKQQVGMGFIDHPKGFVGKVRFRKEVSLIFKKLSTYDKGEYLARNAIRLKSRCGKYTGCAYLRPALTMTNNLDLYKYKVALGADSGLNRLKKIFSLRFLHPDILAEVISHLFNVHIPGRTFNILFVGDQKRGHNRVFYEGDNLHVDWSISPDELEVYREMLRDLEVMLKGLVDEMNIKTDIDDDWLWSMAHHSGTVSMGDKDEDLIDRDLKLRCCDNVFVCDGSVIQEHSYANTGLTIGQLALRLADRIKKEAGLTHVSGETEAQR